VQRRLPVARGDTLHLALEGACLPLHRSLALPEAGHGAPTRAAPARRWPAWWRTSVAVGDTVAAGQPLVCVEAMKMEMWLHAGAAGTVRP
jgi:hypothetical protein